MTFKFHLRLLSILALLCLLGLGCSPRPSSRNLCTNGIGITPIDPSLRPCENDCECNNQNHSGRCVQGRCQSKPREGCEVQGKKQQCLLQVSLGCKVGVQTCQDRGLRSLKWGDCKPFEVVQKEQGGERCGDGIDNDCDGSIDTADIDCQCKLGESRSCGSDVGTCERGTQLCNVLNQWGPCVGEKKPQEEQCDGQDNNCNGQTDEGCGCSPPGRVEPCYTGKPASQNQGTCASGTRICSAQGTWSQCIGEVTPQAEECNLKDDNCDGVIDNTPGHTTNSLQRPCYPHPKGCTRQKDGSYQCVLKSECKVGVQVCLNGNWSLCKGVIAPQTEMCNGKDDDCNGKVDDNLAPEEAPSCPLQAGLCQGARLPTSACQGGKWRPCQRKDYQAHNSLITVQETCDGRDNNCNGKTDEGIVGCLGTLKQVILPHSYEGNLLARSPNQDLYVTHRAQQRIYKLDSCGKWTAFAGDGNIGQRDGQGSQAQFYNPGGIAVDGKGNLYIADTNNHRIRKIDSKGVVSNVAGVGSPGHKDGLAGQALFEFPRYITTDTQNNLYVIDSRGIRKISQGRVSTLVSPQGSPLNYPSSIVVDSKGFLYVADSGSSLIRKISPKGQVSTLSGTGSNQRKDGNLQQASFHTPTLLAWGSNPNLLYVVEVPFGPESSAIRQIDLKHKAVTTLYTSSQTGRSKIPKIISGFALDKKDNFLFITNDGVKTLPRTNPAKSSSICVTTLAGSGTPGSIDQTGDKAQLNLPHSLTIGPKGILYVTDQRNHRVRSIDSTGKVATVAGSLSPGSHDGQGTFAAFSSPSGIVWAGKNLLYLVDTGNTTIRSVSSQGLVKTIIKLTNTTSFQLPLGIIHHPKHHLIVADSGRKQLLTINEKGNVQVFAGDGVCPFVDGKHINCFKNGPVEQARFAGPSSLATDPQGNIYVGDTYEPRIRKIDTNGIVTTFAGTGKPGFKDGPGTIAQFAQPEGLAFGADGFLYVVDTLNHRIRRIAPNGEVTTVAGTGAFGRQNGAGNLATFRSPSGIAFDSQGAIYIADSLNHTIRKLVFQGLQ